MTSAEDYRFLADMLARHSGIFLGDGKEYLLESRLMPIAEQFDLPDLPALVQRLRQGAGAVLVQATVEAMTTQETLFFRDATPFKALREMILPALVPSRRTQGRRLRIWSAACSTGQEPYSVAMLLATLAPPLGPAEAEIVATDYSPKALARAREGLYSQFEVQRGLPAHLLVRFFTQTPGGFRIAEPLRRWVSYQEHNLLQSASALGQFDVILCRNVLIYFDRPVKRSVFECLTQALAPDGYLLLGAAETPYGVTESLVRAPDPCACPGVYVRNGGRARPAVATVAAMASPQRVAASR
ncbi:MAG TPA: protein-glutamate O-methyltransferase CheR [Gemmatimonadales bacterium]|nr:protein-glutamate O-methyltransferase CheR [Gemmatimonadales bacterium]